MEADRIHSGTAFSLCAEAVQSEVRLTELPIISINMVLQALIQAVHIHQQRLLQEHGHPAAASYQHDELLFLLQRVILPELSGTALVRAKTIHSAILREKGAAIHPLVALCQDRRSAADVGSGISQVIHSSAALCQGQDFFR